ncbi:hypothetical protein [Archangium sp.]|uniref:hypothetical protein n=1 Tax=Archangium sp. TaxID=1872627 RepID=UPI002D2B4696|nr:hypothetical protein [Archangium sp.]HYO57530.1 hypothetical protein [Archangium sp.]
MVRELDVEQWKEELVAACRFGDDEQARALVRQLGPRKARALLEALLEEEDGPVRQAAVFGLGDLGGAASVRRLEQQLVREEARGDDDGGSVVEAITQVLGNIRETGARASLVRRLERLATATVAPDLGDVNTLARALWHKRHPELLPVVRRSLEALALSEMNSLRGLLVLLEKSPEALQAWATDSSVPVERKTEVITVLEEEVPETLVPSLLAFISQAHTLLARTVSHQDESIDFYERLLTLLLEHREHLLPLLPAETHSELRTVARTLVATALLNCAIRAAVLLQYVGLPEDADLLMAHRPSDSTLAAVFDDTAQALRRQKSQATSGGATD